MATSPSGPYKSRIVRGLVRQARRWLDRGQTTVRRVQVAASWSAQILLYPVYALFQTGRLLGKTLERSQEATPSRLEPNAELYKIALTDAPADLTVDTSIHNVLLALEEFDLPENWAVQVQEAVTIRAIASQIDSRQLVLMTNTNQVLTLPDPLQQAWLQQRLIYEIAVYNRQRRSHSLPWQRAKRLLSGVQTALQRRFSPALSGFNHSRLDAASEQSDGGSALASDVPIKQMLLAVREWLAQVEMPSLQRSPIPAIEHTRHAALQSTSTIRVRGVASLLAHRRLVLVSDRNAVFDVLTPEQQQFLYQRIAWEVAHYQRYLRLQATPSGLTPLRPPGQQRQILPPVRAFQWLMAWMQSGPVAMATNVFQEASWLACPLPPVATPTTAIAASRPRLKLAQRSLRQDPTASTRGAILSPGSITSIQTTPIHTIIGATSTHATPTHATPTHAISTRLDELNARVPSDTPSSNYIDTRATFVHYEQSLFERVMNWLDRVFLWLETQITALWRRLR
ncbi:MAG: hypothetical protein NW220_23290 [Leptolyngbyaceae cyanobacterium bins.349]|nr:hypothetical protein [Leptolyngbyaceae cyanobacterium bins.349]